MPAVGKLTARLLAAGGVLCTCLLLAACGSSSDSPSKSAAATAADAALKFSRCMREHGVKNFPTPEVSSSGVRVRVKSGGFGSLGVSREAIQKAAQACRKYQQAALPKLSPQERAAREEQVRKFSKCLREHGIKLETESSGTGGFLRGRIRGKGTAGGPNFQSPAFQAAQKACQNLLPKRRGGGPGGGRFFGGPPPQSSGSETGSAVPAP